MAALNEINAMTLPPRAHQLGMIVCQDCGLVCTAPAGPTLICPRCATKIMARKPASMQRTLALLLAGIIFYIPANVLPVMYTRMFGDGNDSTIMSGVLQFWHDGAWDIALIIFIASVLVPCTKFIVLAMLLATVRWRNHWARRDRARMYRLVEIIGYWSMLDVLVVALVAALVQFNALSRIEPRLGIFFFGAVVVLTMLAVMSFDPRLIWDDRQDHE